MGWHGPAGTRNHTDLKTFPPPLFSLLDILQVKHLALSNV